MIGNMKFESKNEKDTMLFAEKFAKSISAPCVILLKGDLGAGKTHFVKGFVKGLKSKETVTSPTFTIMNIYDKGKYPVYHFDLYRLSSSEEAEELGFDDYFNHDSLDGISVVEWPENAPELVKNFDIEIIFTKIKNDDCRLIEINRRILC